MTAIEIKKIDKRKPGLSAGVGILIGLVGLLLIGGLWFGGTYNTLVTKANQIELKASDIDSQTKRRADLVPNLVATVKGYAKHESQIFTEVAQARSRLLNTSTSTNPQEAMAANQSFNSSIGRLLAVAENYPNLKADENFIRLQDELTGTENRINYARLEYNKVVTDYNIQVESFPTNLIAGATGYTKKVTFKASE
ncbi:MAG: LemA family protein, partial [Cyanobacteria bacterium]|nr:LemA family protein [Cyanobacteriota bacterium]